MRHRTARRAWLPLLLLLDLLLPATGKRRRRRRAPSTPYAPVPTPHRICAPVPLLRGEDNALVRPYLNVLETAR